MPLSIRGIVHLVGENPEEDRLERVNSNNNDGEKNQFSSSRSTSSVDAGGRYQENENHQTGLIPLQGCSGGDAFQLLNSRWMAALNAYNNLPYDSSERPVMYTKRSSSGQSMLPHQVRGSFAVSQLRSPTLCFSLSVDVTSWRCIFS